jgi:hypothetical protein
MITFNLSRSSNLSLDSINEILKEGLEKNEEIIFYSGDIIKIFLRENKNKNKKAFGCFSPEQETFIELIKKIFFLKKAKILNFEKFDKIEISKIKNYYKGDIIGYLVYFILSYLFLKKISKNINETDILLKELIKIDRTFNYDIIDFIIKNFDKNEFDKLTDKFVLYDNEN